MRHLRAACGVARIRFAELPPTTVIAKLEQLRDMTGLGSIMLHYPPWYGVDKAFASLEMFAAEVMPKFRPPQPARMRA